MQTIVPKQNWNLNAKQRNRIENVKKNISVMRHFSISNSLNWLVKFCTSALNILTVKIIQSQLWQRFEIAFFRQLTTVRAHKMKTKYCF